MTTFITTQSDNYLFWVDLEMTGLNLEHDTILEIATVVTTSDLTSVAQGPSIAIHQSDAVLERMDDWNKNQHKKSGLLDAVQQSSISLEEAYQATMNFARTYCKENTSPLCGNTVFVDRSFLKKYMPKLDAYFHYRIIDVSTVKELVRRWYSSDPGSKFEKDSHHRALQDIYYSIEELKFYRTRFFK